MQLLTEEIRAKLPKLYATDGNQDAKCVVKFFTPDANWTWYAFEFDPESQTFFGLVDGFEREWGYFNLAELALLRGPMGLPVERDLYYTPQSKRELNAA